MPTVFRHRGYAFRVYTNDHPPPHVHIVGAEGHAVVDLLNWCVTRMKGIPEPLLRELADKSGEQSAVLWKAWERLHGRKE